MKRSFILLVCLCGFLGTTLAHANSYRTDSLSYENYCRMLDREGLISLSSVEEETVTGHLKERERYLKSVYVSDKRAYNAFRRQCLDVRQQIPSFVSSLITGAGMVATRAGDIEKIFSDFNDLELKLIDSIGPKNFVERYIAMGPKFSCLKLLRDAKLRECMDASDHYRYFVTCILFPFPSDDDRERTEEDYVRSYYIRQPLFREGSIQAWLGAHLNYPREALKKGIQEQILVNFIVNEDGSVSDIEIIKGSTTCLIEEARKVVKMLPPFIPGWDMRNKCKIRTRYTLPISFKF